MPEGAGVDPTNRMQEVLTDQLLLYQGQFLPIEQMMLNRQSQAGSDVARSSAAAKGFSAGITGFEPLVGKATAGLTSQGLDPTSGRFQSAMSDIARVRGIGAGAGSFKGSMSAEDEFFKLGMDNLGRAGAVKRRGILGLSRASYYQNVLENEKQRETIGLRDMRDQIKRGWWSAAGNIAGTGLGAYAYRKTFSPHAPGTAAAVAGHASTADTIASSYIGKGKGPTPGAFRY